MLSKPYYGFIDMELSDGNEKNVWTIGNLTNAPLELLDTCIAFYKEKKSQMVEVNLEEFGTGTILLDSKSNSVYYYSTCDSAVSNGGSVFEFATKIRDDISSFVKEYSMFYYAADEKDEAKFEKKLRELSDLLQ